MDGSWLYMSGDGGERLRLEYRLGSGHIVLVVVKNYEGSEFYPIYKLTSHLLPPHGCWQKT